MGGNTLRRSAVVRDTLDPQEDANKMLAFSEIFLVLDIMDFMDLPFLRFYPLFNLWVVAWLYGLSSLIAAAS